MKKMVFEYWSKKNWRGQKQWRFRLRAANGEKIIPTEDYWNEKDLLHTIDLIRSSSDAEIVNITGDPKRVKG